MTKVASALLVLAACSSSSSSTMTAASPDAGAMSFDAGATSQSLPYSTYAIFQHGATNAPPGTASFTTTFGSALPPSTCGLPVLGPEGCCHATQQGVAAAAVEPLVSAGTISFTANGNALGAPATYAAGGYAIDEVATPAFAWDPGSILTWSPAGDVAHAFETAITAPQFPANINPAFGIAPVTVSRAKDFTVTWTPGTDAATKVLLSVLGTDDTVYCSGLDAAGTLTIPAATLAQLTSAHANAFNLTRYASVAASSDNTAILTVAMASISIQANFTE